MRKKLLCGLLIFFFFNLKAFCGSPLEIPENPDVIRLKIDFDSANSLLGTSDNGEIKFLEQENKDQSIALKAMTKYKIKINSLGDYDLLFIKNGKEYKITDLSVPFSIKTKDDSLIYLGNRWYRGKIEIIKNNSGIIAVNYVYKEHLLSSIIGALVENDTATEAIKAGIVIMRSSFSCLTQSKTRIKDYDINARDIDYIGIESEKDIVKRFIKATEGEILLDSRGKLICTDFKTAFTEKAFPFVLIGEANDSWEKTFSFDEITYELKEANYKINNILEIEKRIMPQTSKIMIAIITDKGQINLSMFDMQKIFGLPSQFFRIYSYKDKNNKDIIQFMGNLAGYNEKGQYQSILNLITSLEDSISYPSQNYKSLLKDLYPNSYLARL